MKMSKATTAFGVRACCEKCVYVAFKRHPYSSAALHAERSPPVATHGQPRRQSRCSWGGSSLIPQLEQWQFFSHQVPHCSRMTD